jgi:hypothetical protein
MVETITSPIMAEPIHQPLLDVGSAEARGAQGADGGDTSRAGPLARERRQLLGDRRLQCGVARQHRKSPVAAFHRPPGFGVGRDPHGGALRQKGQALGATRQRAVESAIALLQGGQEPVVEDEPCAGHAREDAAHDVAGRAAAAREDDRQRLVRAERPLERGLVVFHEDSADDGDTRRRRAPRRRPPRPYRGTASLRP